MERDNRIRVKIGPLGGQCETLRADAGNSLANSRVQDLARYPGSGLGNLTQVTDKWRRLCLVAQNHHLVPLATSDSPCAMSLCPGHGARPFTAQQIYNLLDKQRESE
jgi:hypothetical protein